LRNSAATPTPRRGLCLTGVDASTIYVGLLKEQYGRLLASGFSATEAESLRARERGKHIAVYTAADAPGREAISLLYRTCPQIRDDGELPRHPRPRPPPAPPPAELAAGALSPWMKLGNDCAAA
jgi:hypothetical protein